MHIHRLGEVSTEMKFTKRHIQALVKEAKSHGLDVTGEQDRLFPNRALLFLSPEYPENVALAFAQKYKSRVMLPRDDKDYIPVDIRDTKMTLSVLAFYDANIQLSKCEHELDKVVEPIVKKAKAENNAQALHDLLDTLPPTYKGVRRIYELLERM